MDLFPKWTGSLKLPALPERRVKVGSNFVVQRPFGGFEKKARIFRSEIKGHDVIVFDASAPYHEILLRHRGARKVSTELPVVISREIVNADKLPETFALEWESFGSLSEYADTPEKVISAWKNKFMFRIAEEETKSNGLRLPQVGALHCIAGHFSVGEEFEAATVVLPTGTGKTETMLAVQVYRQLTRSLVIVPTTTLRRQISEKFISLGILPKAEVVPWEIAKPRVAIIQAGLASREEAEAILKEANVIVALPQSLEASAPDAVIALFDGCSDLIVDEAHHVTAPTWQRIRGRFSKKRILQFTATPFRRDEKRVDGKIIFNYKLGEAQEADYFRPINLRTIEEFGSAEERDRAIAAAAVEALRRDRNELKLDHLLLARTHTKERAEAVAAIYAKLAPEFKPVTIYSGPGRASANKVARDALFDRSEKGSRIVVCVDMLGEGFDLPNLKVAAFHDVHKSLAVTLQFIGRFTRGGPKDLIGEATAIVNIAEQEAENKLEALYAEGADWDRIIKRLSEDRIEEELRLQDVVYGLKAKGNLHDQLSLWNLRPVLSAQFFRTTCIEWQPMKYKAVLPRDAETWHSLNEKENILVAVVCRSGVVTWGEYQNILDTVYDLVILRWDKDAKVLCLYASDYNAMRSEKMAKEVAGENTTLVSGESVFKILNDVQLPLVKSLGSSRIGAISFTSYFGPNVTEGLADIEKKQSSLNNIACLGYENGEKVLWGCTERRGKVWQQKAGTIAQWIEWTKMTWGKVISHTPLKSNVVEDFLRPQKLAKPYGSQPVAVQWGEHAQTKLSDRQYVLFGETQVPFFAVEVGLGESDKPGAIRIRIEGDTNAAEYDLIIDESLPGGYKYSHVRGSHIQFRQHSGAAVPIDEYLLKDPFIIRYADGSTSYNCYHIPVNFEAGEFDAEKIEVWDWTGIPLNAESIGKAGNRKSIQYAAYENMEAEFDLVFNDDGKGEVADLVCFKDLADDTILLRLVHCKGAYDGKVSKDIRNFYIVCGQAQKCTTAKHTGMPKLYIHLKNRHEIWRSEGKTRFLKGDLAKLAYFKEKSRRAKIRFEVVLVQPGASKETITADSLRLLATTDLYLRKTTSATFRVVTSK